MKIVITHQNADFDGLASMLGVRKLWPDHQLVLGSAVSPPVQKYLALHRDWLIVTSRQQLKGQDVEEVVVVDSRDRRRFSEFSDYFDQADSITVFDHHPAGEHDIESTVDIIEPVGACATLLCERIESRGIELDAEEATLMMLGIYADTGSLSFPSTSVRDLRAAAFLRQSGASLPVVNRYLKHEYSPEQQRLLVALINDIEIIERQGLELGYASQETPTYVKGASLVVERIMQLMGLDACFAVLQERDREAIQIIGRSLSRHIDAAKVAELWDGGGHRSAAAARTKSMSRQQVTQALRDHLCGLDIAPLEVTDVMSSPVQVVAHDMKLEELAPKLDKWAFTGVPVVREGQLAGIVSRRDVDEAVSREDWSVPVAGFMTHDVVTIGPETSIEDALELMTVEDIGRLPVVDNDAIVGIISRSDILRRLYSGEDEE